MAVASIVANFRLGQSPFNTHKNKYYNLQINSFINHAILNKTTIKSTLGLQTVGLIYILMGYQVYELQILVSVKKIIVVIEKQSIIA